MSIEVNDQLDLEPMLPRAEVIVEEGSSEVLDKKPRAIIVYGHHSRNEAIAPKIVERLDSSKAGKRYDLEYVRQPEGLCYVDAYEEARKRPR